jgi:hypothetical protein
VSLYGQKPRNFTIPAKWSRSGLLVNAYARGRFEHADGLRLKTNPFPPGKRHQAWIAGWLDADAEAIAKMKGES